MDRGHSDEREVGERIGRRRFGGVGHHIERRRRIRDHGRANVGTAVDDCDHHRTARLSDGTGRHAEDVGDADEPVGFVDNAEL